MRARDFKQVEALLSVAEAASLEGTVLAQLRQLYGPMQRVWQALPPSWQSLPAIYVATQNRTVAGLIWLQREPGQRHRWQIEQLLLHPEYGSLETGEYLLQYVIHRFGASGVQQFLARVDVGNEQALSLFKQANFRQLDRRYDFKLTPAEVNVVPADVQIEGLREATDTDAALLRELYLETLAPTVRPYLDKPVSQYTTPWWQWPVRSVQGRFQKRWLVDSPHGVLGMVGVSSWDYQRFQLELSVSPGWPAGLERLVRFGVAHCAQHTRQPLVMLSLYGSAVPDAHHVDNAHTVVKAQGFTCWQELLLLAKDYWRPDKTPQPLNITSPLLLAGGEPSTT